MTQKKLKKRAANFRLLTQIAWFALTNGYVRGFAGARIYSGTLKNFCAPGLNCYSCPGAFFACPIGSLQSLLSNGSLKASCYVVGAISFFGVFFGRAVCGFLCPFGLVQDLVYRIPFFKKRKNLPAHKMLVWLRYVALALFVVILPLTVLDEFGFGITWFCKYICPSGTIFAGVPLVAGNGQLRAAAGFLFSWKVCVLLAVLVLSLWAWRPFCKYVCPLGAIYGLFNKASFYNFSVDKSKCTECGACRAVCKADIKAWKNPNSADCVRCGECVSCCPTNALRSGIARAGVVRA